MSHNKGVVGILSFENKMNSGLNECESHLLERNSKGEKMKKLFVFCSVFLSLLCINNAYAAILTLEGPSLDIESSGWGETGIQILLYRT